MTGVTFCSFLVQDKATQGQLHSAACETDRRHTPSLYKLLHCICLRISKWSMLSNLCFCLLLVRCTSANCSLGAKGSKYCGCFHRLCVCRGILLSQSFLHELLECKGMFLSAPSNVPCAHHSFFVHSFDFGPRVKYWSIE